MRFKKVNITQNWRNFLTEEEKERDIMTHRTAARFRVNLVDFEPEYTREIAQMLADKLGGELGEELGRGAMGVVYDIRMQGGEGRDMILKVTQHPHEKKGYTLTRWKKRALEHKNPEIASVLPDVGRIVDDIYDFKEGYHRGSSIKVYGIPVERLVPLPDRIKEELFGHGGGFKSKKYDEEWEQATFDPRVKSKMRGSAEKEWLKAISDPKTLISVLRSNFSAKNEIDGNAEQYYTYFGEIPPNEEAGTPGRSKMQAGEEFEQMVLDLEPPGSFEDYLLRWIPQIKRRALHFVDNTPTRSSLSRSLKQRLRDQADKLPQHLEDMIKIPQYPPEALPYFGTQGAHPSGESEDVVDQFFNKLQALGPEGVKFWDTHRDNVMMRPETNEIVVSDVGLFHSPKKDD